MFSVKFATMLSLGTLLVAGSASAQAAHPTTAASRKAWCTAHPGRCADVKQDRREIRHDKRELAADRREIKHDLRAGDKREAKQDHRELRRDRRDLKGDKRDRRHDLRDDAKKHG